MGDSKFCPVTEGDKHCAKCYYHFRYGQHGVGCEFILVTGKRRDCEPGLRCKRFLEGDPKSRWKLREGQELRPGYLFGQECKPEPKPVEEKTTRDYAMPEDRQLLPLDIGLWVQFRREHKTAALARDLGVHEQTIYAVKKRGTISRRMARQILELYGVDLLQK